MTAKEHEQELADLFTYFETAKFPQAPFRLNKYMTIVSDPKIFIRAEIHSIERYKGSDEVRDSLFQHLRGLKAICEAQN